MPENRLSLSRFHEAGHALNYNGSTIGKIRLYCHPIGRLLVLPIAAIGLFKIKKSKGEKPENIFDKVTTFIKNNSGKLTFAALLPMLIEEGLASYKGNKLAKEFLNPDLAKKVAKNNRFAYMSYLSFALFSALGVASASSWADTFSKLIKAKAKGHNNFDANKI